MDVGLGVVDEGSDLRQIGLQRLADVFQFAACERLRELVGQAISIVGQKDRAETHVAASNEERALRRPTDRIANGLVAGVAGSSKLKLRGLGRVHDEVPVRLTMDEV
jgi:hypothetical protein